LRPLSGRSFAADSSASWNFWANCPGRKVIAYLPGGTATRCAQRNAAAKIASR
jgi:hypothetical protein